MTAQPHPELNMQAILTKNSTTDYYAVLGADSTSSREQIVTEFKARVRPTDDEEERKDRARRFHELHRAYEVLSDPESRAKYDRYLASGLNLSFDTWLEMQQHQRVMHWAIPKKKPTLVQGPFHTHQ